MQTVLTSKPTLSRLDSRSLFVNQLAPHLELISQGEMLKLVFRSPLSGERRRTSFPDPGSVMAAPRPLVRPYRNRGSGLCSCGQGSSGQLPGDTWAPIPLGAFTDAAPGPLAVTSLEPVPVITLGSFLAREDGKIVRSWGADVCA